MPPPPEIFVKSSYPEIKSDGFWQLADYPTLVFTCKCILEQESLGFKVIMTYLLPTFVGGGGENWPLGGGISQVSPPPPPLYETLHVLQAMKSC